MIRKSENGLRKHSRPVRFDLNLTKQFIEPEALAELWHWKSASASGSRHEPKGIQRITTRKCAFTKLEMLVAATLLSTMFAVASPLFARLNQVWTSTRWYQLASQELMNQMESMTQLSPQECTAAIENIEIAPEVLAAIPGAQLTGEMEPSSDGHRIVLSIQLPGSVRSEPIVLVGWLHNQVLSSEGLSGEVIP